MSATLDGARVARLMGDAPVVASEGRAFPVETRYVERDPNRRVEDSVADAVLALNLPGVDTIREPRRILPSGDVGSSLIGRTDIDGVGTGGLEMQYQEQLAGTDGERVREHDRQGRSIPGSGTTTVEPVPGDDLVLTIDRTLQYQVEQALVTRVSALKAKGGSVVVMDTATGDIYAVANVSRDPETYEVGVTSANLAAVEAFEPGSVAKVFSLSGVVDSGVADPTTEIDVPGKLTFDPDTTWEKTISDAEPHDLMKMTMRNILVHSSNLGTYLLTDRLGGTRLEEYLRLFGFGEKTALQFPGETAGKVHPASEWKGSEKATVTYGYHYQTSALQLAAAVNTVANHGTYVAPRLVRGYVGSDGTVTEVAASATHPVISASAAATMTDMLTGVVCEGTGREAQLKGISVAGKTGTAYKAQNGGYGDATSRRYRASFVGYFPAQAPRVTILVTIDEPDPTSNDRFGGKAAAPLFAKIATLALHELRIAPQPGDTGCPAA